MNPFLKQFEELQVVGRGNFGSATLVKEYASQQVYIAKKVILEGLKEKEQISSKQEAELLKSLQHPNIVAFKDQFLIDGTLIIIMEYCQEGDLAFHIKRMKTKGELLPESLILNWFLQIALALSYVHSHKILHRDIKTSNIFLNSEGDIKVGDFGISRVLEHTQDNAQTVVGTPPEVCESKPYTQKSDVWALACVIYELCTYKHAFNSNNLLGLVFKIVKEEVEDIPNCYSKDLKNVLKKMFAKDEAARPTIQQILKEPFLFKAAKEFIDTQGKNVPSSNINVKTFLFQSQQAEKEQKLEDPELGQTFQSQMSGGQNGNSSFTIGATCMSGQQTQKGKYDNTLGDTVQSNYQAFGNTAQGQNNLTTKQKLDLKKQQRAEEEAQMIKQAMRENASSTNIAKARKQDQLNHSNLNSKTVPANSMNQLQQQQQNYLNYKNQIQYGNQASQQNNYFSQTGHPQNQYNHNFNNQVCLDLNAITQQMANLNVQGNTQYYNQPFDISSNQQMYNVPQYNNQYNPSSSYQNYNYGNTTQTNPQFTQTQLNNDLMQYNNSQFEEYNSDEDEDDNKNQTFSLSQTKGLNLTKPGQRESVLNAFQDFVNKNKNEVLEEILEQSGESIPMTPQKVGKEQPLLQSNNSMSKTEKIKQECIQSLTEPLFKKAYSLIKSRGMSEAVRKELTNLVGKQNLSKCQKVEELVYLESQGL